MKRNRRGETGGGRNGKEREMVMEKHKLLCKNGVRRGLVCGWVGLIERHHAPKDWENIDKGGNTGEETMVE